ncbi:MAG: hypothetical protein QXH08_06750 [Candidatus Hadarchaeales archaeon]
MAPLDLETLLSQMIMREFVEAVKSLAKPLRMMAEVPETYYEPSPDKRSKTVAPASLTIFFSSSKISLIALERGDSLTAYFLVDEL